MSEPIQFPPHESAVETPQAPAADDPAAKLAVLQKERDELYNRFLRQAADFDNFMKRSRQEVDDERRRAAGETIRALLPVQDDLDRAVAAAGSGTESASLLAGVKLVQDKFVSTLRKLGAEPIETVGKPFDPTRHEAILFETTDRVADQTVLEELVRGYSFGPRVLRPAKVKISKTPE